MVAKEKARMAGFRYEGKKNRTDKKVEKGHKDSINFQEIEKDVNVVGETLFVASRLMDLIL